jgi:hypothetical protein
LCCHRGQLSGLPSRPPLPSSAAVARSSPSPIPPPSAGSRPAPASAPSAARAGYPPCSPSLGNLAGSRPAPAPSAARAARRPSPEDLGRRLLHRSAVSQGRISLSPSLSAARGSRPPLSPSPSAARSPSLLHRRPPQSSRGRADLAVLCQGPDLGLRSPLPGTSSADPLLCQKSAPAAAVADRATDLRCRCSHQPLFNSASAPRTPVNSSTSGCSGLFGLRSPVLPDF